MPRNSKRKRSSPDQNEIIIQCHPSTHASHELVPNMNLSFTKAEPTDTCCISQSPISETNMDFLPDDTPLFPEHPLLNKVTIVQCGHQFHALSLVYHFFRNSMACPMCRYGITNKTIALKCFRTNKIAKNMHKRVRKLQLIEQAAQLEQETEELRQQTQQILAANGAVHILTDITQDLIQTAPLISIYSFNSQQDIHAPVFRSNCFLSFSHVVDEMRAAHNQPTQLTRMICYTTTPPNARRLSALINPTMNIDTLLLHVTTRNPYTNLPIRIACSDYFDLNNIQETGTSIEATDGNGIFHISTFPPRIHGDPPTISSIRFDMPIENFWTSTIQHLLQE